jgi:crossover junction endodeoxyribonuclease RuvC
MISQAANPKSEATDGATQKRQNIAISNTRSVCFGVDPGSVNCGWGAVWSDGHKFELVEYGVIHLAKQEKEIAPRLKIIFERLSAKIEDIRPDSFSVESVFFSKNVQSLVKLSHARAAAILSASANNVPVFEYSPNSIKKAVTGKGKASKEQVQFMVKNMLNIKETPDYFDATDGLAAAICHLIKAGTDAPKAQNWAQFVKDNPEKII